MKFETFSELLAHVEKLGPISSLEFDVSVDEAESEPCTDCDASTEPVALDGPDSDVRVIESVTWGFSDDTKEIEYIIDNGITAHRLFVEDYESLQVGSCFTGKVKISGSTILCNLCEGTAGTTITLPVRINGKSINLPVVLERGMQTTLTINPELLDAN